MQRRSIPSSSLLLTLALGLLGCGDDSTGTMSASDTATGSTSTASTTAAETAGTASTSTATSMATTSMSTTSMSTTSMSTTSTSTTASTTATTAETTSTTGLQCLNQEKGAVCSAACDCMSNECWTLGPLGGICSDCDSDEDCAATTGFGCNAGNPLGGVPAICSATGTAGQGCESTKACADGFVCAPVYVVPVFFDISTCGECNGPADCPGEFCVPEYDLEALAGSWVCTQDMVPNNGGCALEGDGSECESGQCAPASLMGIPLIGVCSPCNEDVDCGGGTCQLPELAFDGPGLALTPGACL